jgi:hypothetical protein
MTISFPKLYSFLAILLFCLLFTSCFQSKNKEEEVLEEADSKKDDEYNGLAVQGLSKIPSWVNHWKGVAPSFDPNKFKKTRVLNFELLEYPEEVPYQSSSVFYTNLLAHPGGKGVVDIYGYKIVLPESNTPYFNADSEVAYYRTDGMRERLLFMGPSGGFEEAIWVSEDYLMVVGFFEEENGVSPKMWLIHTEKRVYIVFDHPLYVPEYGKESYLREKFNKVNF